MGIRDRIVKDIEIFKENIRKIDKKALSNEQTKVVELSEMYAKDAVSWLDKGEYYTAFSSISYAHGLLDAVIKINPK